MNEGRINLLCNGLEGLEDQVGLVDESVGTDKHVYCPGRQTVRKGMKTKRSIMALFLI